ncbi:unnamed protein product [Lymnaea stagnalis]|uniref:UBC core domain-containing protein n=1 Tax=Lymnaea stagnalis TaxID=6523 RepID=A0AAV2HJA7_LYMST
MDISSLKNEAADYLTKSGCSLVVTHDDEKNNQIHLESRGNSFKFYITCPSSDSPSWNIWSDHSGSQKQLQYVLDSCNLDDCKSITAVLEKVSASINLVSSMKTFKATASADEDMEVEENDADEADDFDSYYGADDVDAQEDDVKLVSEDRESEEKLATRFFKGNGSEMAVKRLVKDLKNISVCGPKFGFLASPVENNLFVWQVKLTNIPTDTRLGKDLVIYAKKYNQEPVITLDMQFPTDYPFSPPFIRVLKPRFQFLTGHVTIGGSICMQMLTKSGWCPTNDIESILVQVRSEILSDPKASLDVHKSATAYSEIEARTAFQRMVEKYGW